jgi:hypothetical protein
MRIRERAFEVFPPSTLDLAADRFEHEAAAVLFH